MTPPIDSPDPHPEENDHPLNIRARYWYTKSILNYRAIFYILFLLLRPHQQEYALGQSWDCGTEVVQSTPRTSLAGNIPGRWDRDGVVHPINVPEAIYVPKRDQSKKYYWDIHRVRRTSLSDILCMS